MFSLFIILSILGILICLHQYWNAGFHLGTPWMETYVKSQRWPLRGVKIFCNKHQKAMTNTTRRLFTVDKRYICNRITTSGCWARCTKANTSNHCSIVRSCVRGCSSLLAVVVQHVVHASRSASRPRFQGSPRGSFGHLSTLMTLWNNHLMTGFLGRIAKAGMLNWPGQHITLRLLLFWRRGLFLSLLPLPPRTKFHHFLKTECCMGLVAPTPGLCLQVAIFNMRCLMLLLQLNLGRHHKRSLVWPPTMGRQILPASLQLSTKAGKKIP